MPTAAIRSYATADSGTTPSSSRQTGRGACSSQAVELSKRDDLIKRLNFERDSQEIEIIALKEHPAIISYQVAMNDEPEGLVNDQTRKAVLRNYASRS